MNYPEKARRVIDIEIHELQRLRERVGGSFATAIDLILPATAGEDGSSSSAASARAETSAASWPPR